MSSLEHATVPAAKGAGRLPWILLAVLVVAHAGTALATSAARGIPWDEPVQRTYGEAVVEWYTSGFDPEVLEDLGNLILYGGIVEGALEAIADVLPGDPYTIRHAAVGLLATLGLVGVFVLGWQLSGAWVGLVAAALLVAMPRYIGHGFFNSKDVPMAVFYLWTVVALVRELRMDPLRPLRTALPLGVALGLLLGTRIGGGIIALPMLAGFGWAWWSGERTWRLAVRRTARFSAVSLTGWLVMLVGWPWAQQRPFLGPLVALRASSRFPWELPELFRGEMISSLSLPLGYVPVWLWETTPEIVLLGVAVLVAAVVVERGARLRTDVALPAVVLAALVPVVWVVGTRAALYDGPRHLLFIQPLVALGAAAGLAWALRRFAGGARLLALAALGVLWALPIVEMARLHPYEYVYFNRAAGGLTRAEGRMELDYWGLSYRAGAEWLTENVTDSDGVRVASCSNPTSTSYFLLGGYPYLGSFRFEVTGEPQYVLYTALHDCLPGVPEGEVVHEITRMGVPLLSVVETPAASEPRPFLPPPP